MRPTKVTIPRRRPLLTIPRIGIVASTCLLAACGEDDIRVYRVPKEPGAQTVQTAAPARPSSSTAVTWTLPDGWEQVPGERNMRIATFRAGADESAPEVSLSAFPGDAGGLLPNINRWRGQIGLDATDNAALATSVQSTTIEGVAVSVVDMLGSDNNRMLGAVVVPGDGQTWFIKATDAPGRIEAIAASFSEFARSFRLTTTSAPSPHPKSAGAAAAGLPDRMAHWSPPPHWQHDPDASPILSAAFLATSNDGGARITVTSLKGSGGGTLANINRWRGQLGLGPVASLAEQTTTDLGAGALIVDLSSDDQSSRMVAAILPSTGSVWYFKMTGSVAGVGAERAEFERFVRTVGLGDDATSPATTGMPGEQEGGP